jgi:hypothetical protein
MTDTITISRKTGTCNLYSLHSVDQHFAIQEAWNANTPDRTTRAASRRAANPPPNLPHQQPLHPPSFAPKQAQHFQDKPPTSPLPPLSELKPSEHPPTSPLPPQTLYRTLCSQRTTKRPLWNCSPPCSTHPYAWASNIEIAPRPRLLFWSSDRCTTLLQRHRPAYKDLATPLCIRHPST